MSKIWYYLLGVAVMALVTYIPRVLPLAVFRKPIKSRFIRSFLEYMPVAVLAAMTFPAIFDATASPISAAAGLVIALVFSYIGYQLLPVALLSSAAVFVTELILFGWKM